MNELTPILFAFAAGLLVAALILCKPKPRVDTANAPVAQTRCSECGRELPNLIEYRYQNGAARIIAPLCRECANAWYATPLAQKQQEYPPIY
ncbi:MAG: hypothetical protein H0U76_11915 [Ktedonobacteraceae bacterium]|nr:hypothetical protein [Ktedonobacteraceae bacterium]